MVCPSSMGAVQVSYQATLETITMQPLWLLLVHCHRHSYGFPLLSSLFSGSAVCTFDVCVDLPLAAFL